jgi:hypothetical protein
MKERPILRIDPERLKAERRDVDLGSAGETDHNHVGHESGRAPADDADPMQQPTNGSTPPAR